MASAFRKCCCCQKAKLCSDDSELGYVDPGDGLTTGSVYVIGEYECAYVVAAVCPDPAPSYVDTTGWTEAESCDEEGEGKCVEADDDDCPNPTVVLSGITLASSCGGHAVTGNPNQTLDVDLEPSEGCCAASVDLSGIVVDGQPTTQAFLTLNLCEPPDASSVTLIANSNVGSGNLKLFEWSGVLSDPLGTDQFVPNQLGAHCSEFGVVHGTGGQLSLTW